MLTLKFQVIHKAVKKKKMKQKLAVFDALKVDLVEYWVPWSRSSPGYWGTL